MTISTLRQNGALGGQCGKLIINKVQTTMTTAEFANLEQKYGESLLLLIRIHVNTNTSLISLVNCIRFIIDVSLSVTNRDQLRLSASIPLL